MPFNKNHPNEQDHATYHTLADCLLQAMPSGKVAEFLKELDSMTHWHHRNYIDTFESFRPDHMESFLSAFVKELEDRDYKVNGGYGDGPMTLIEPTHLTGSQSD